MNIYQLLNNNNILQQFEQFKKTFTGDPKQQVQQMLTNGQLSKEQFEQLAKQATQIRGILPR